VPQRLTPTYPQAIGREKQADTASKGLQGRSFHGLVDHIPAIMGLPVAETYALLNAAGISTFGAK
jgi:predicted house-cleaning NTP pyrophosphatase (Maf/HAM1 superfamily)